MRVGRSTAESALAHARNLLHAPDPIPVGATIRGPGTTPTAATSADPAPVGAPMPSAASPTGGAPAPAATAASPALGITVTPAFVPFPTDSAASQAARPTTPDIGTAALAVAGAASGTAATAPSSVARAPSLSAPATAAAPPAGAVAATPAFVAPPTATAAGHAAGRTNPAVGAAALAAAGAASGTAAPAPAPVTGALTLATSAAATAPFAGAVADNPSLVAPPTATATRYAAGHTNPAIGTTALAAAGAASGTAAAAPAPVTRTPASPAAAPATAAPARPAAASAHATAVAPAPAAAIVATAGAAGDGRDFVASPAVHLRGGPNGQVTAETSAGHINWVDGLNAYTVRNLANQLVSGAPRVGKRLVKIGCLFSDEARAGFLGNAFVGTCLPPGDTRSPLQAKTDRRAYKSIVHTANYCAALCLDVGCTRAVVKQALHVAERGNHLLVNTVLSAIKNDFEKHTVSATRKGTKTTMAKYAGYIQRFCVWGGENLPADASLFPLSRHSVVMFLEAEAGRRLVGHGSTRPPRRRPGEDATRGVDEDDYKDDGDDYSAAGASDTEAPAVGERGGPSRPAKRPWRAGGGGGQSPASGPVRFASLMSPSPNTPRGTNDRGDSGGGGAASPGRARGTGSAPPHVQPVDGPSAAGRWTARVGGGWATSGPEAARGPRRLVSHHTVMGALNALAKTANMCNPLWRLATCACCRKWSVPEYESAGSFHAGTAIVERRKRDRLLQETSAGSAKALGKRKQLVSDEQRRGVAQALLLRPTTAVEFQRLSRLNALYLLQFAMAARGATARDMTWSDIAVNTFPGMFPAGGKEQPVLCFYVSATKTTEGVVRCIGALPHVDEWACIAGGVADAFYEKCHRPGGVAFAPSGSFLPVYMPNDEKLLEAGVRPAHFREAGVASIRRQLY